MRPARRPTVWRLASHGTRADVLPLLAQALDAQSHGIAWTQINRRPLPETHSRGSTGGDDVAGVQTHHARQIADQFRNAEDHVGAVAVLIAPAIHFEPHRERVWIGDLIFRDQPGTERTKGVAPLALVPGTAAFQLELPLRYVMDHAVARDMG